MKNQWGLRLFKLFVLFGVPSFGLLYAFQFIGQTGETAPFRAFIPGLFSVSRGANASDKTDIPLESSLTIVNFWATWCPPCVEEFPSMVEMRRQLAGKDIRLVFVSVDEDWNNVLQFLNKNSVPYDPETMFWDPSRKTAETWGTTQFPETYVLRRDSWAVERIIGAQVWSRPTAIDYFVKLADKFKNVTKKSTAHAGVLLHELLISSAFAQEATEAPVAAPKAKKKEAVKAVAVEEPMIHEQDQKNLEKLRANIGVATTNLQNAEAAEKEESRNLQEQKIVFERRQKELSEAQSDLEKIEAKAKEIAGLLSKTSDSLKAEEREKKKVEAQIRDIQNKITELQKRIEQSKDELNQANKGLNTRVQAIETYEKAKESSEEEGKSLSAKKETAAQLVSDRKKEAAKASKEISDRERKLAEIRTQMARAKKVLEEQKKKLSEFDQMLKK